MDTLFSLDSPLIRWLSRITDLIFLNFVFMISCIPIFTIGAAITSMYEMTLKMVRNEESYVFRGYFKAFKGNFKKSTKVWLIYCVLFVVLYIDLVVTNQMDGTFWIVLHIIFIISGIFMWMMMAYIFPLQAKFENTLKNTLLNAFVFCFKYLLTTIGMVILNSLFFFCLLFNGYTFIYGTLIYLFLGFSTVAYWNSKMLSKKFQVYVNEMEKSAV